MFIETISKLLKKNNTNTKLKWKDIPRKVKDLILYGNDEFDGIITFLNNRYNNTERFWVQYELEKYQSERNCNLCEGYRLNEKPLAVKIDDCHIGQITKKSIKLLTFSTR